ncbi:MAG: transposase [Nocardioidaceae bacterium]|nr:transposase [Nocardioidaceae bacterium]
MGLLDAACRNADDLATQAEQAFAGHPDANIIASFPGIGELTGARVLGEIGDDRTRFADARGLKAYAGSAPITRASGRSRRHCCIERSRERHAANLAVRRHSTSRSASPLCPLRRPDGAGWGSAQAAGRKICCAGLTRWLNATVPNELISTLGLTQEEVGEIVDASGRSVARWANGEVVPQRLNKQRLVELAYVAEAVSHVIPADRANLWMFTPNRLLGHDTPADRIRNGDYRAVLELIEAIADGVVV